ncbi:MAG: 50S ribosomal protein L24 [Candidatus Yanofskybacteria bacterium]|nr:50S ribosomal protein L24 [Candidatus Yanofskybacteria bacterium]
MNIKKGDNVQMIGGKDRGKAGKVLFVFPSKNLPASGKAIVEGLNKVAKHQRARKQGQKGQIVHKERAVSVSSMMLVCKSCGKPTRVGYKVSEGGKVRVCKKCGAEN